MVEYHKEDSLKIIPKEFWKTISKEKISAFVDGKCSIMFDGTEVFSKDILIPKEDVDKIIEKIKMTTPHSGARIWNAAPHGGATRT